VTGRGSAESRVDCVICGSGSVRVVECLGIGVGISFNVGQRVLVNDHICVLCPFIVQVETFARAGTNAVGPLPATDRVRLARQVPCLATRSFSKGVSVVGNLQHLHMLRHPELADTTVSVHVASIPVLERAFLGVVGRSGVNMNGFLDSGTY
jgi:hypothetical protein